MTASTNIPVTASTNIHPRDSIPLASYMLWLLPIWAPCAAALVYVVYAADLVGPADVWGALRPMTTWQLSDMSDWRNARWSMADIFALGVLTLLMSLCVGCLRSILGRYLTLAAALVYAARTSSPHTYASLADVVRKQPVVTLACALVFMCMFGLLLRQLRPRPQPRSQPQPRPPQARASSKTARTARTLLLLVLATALCRGAALAVVHRQYVEQILRAHPVTEALLAVDWQAYRRRAACMCAGTVLVVADGVTQLLVHLDRALRQYDTEWCGTATTSTAAS